MLPHISDKIRQISSFFIHSSTPIALSMDALRLKRTGFVAVSRDGLKLAIRPSVGESFTFYENLVRRDYLGGEIALKPGDTVVDIGANIGTFSILAASVAGPSGRVIACEPVPETFERLKANVALNGLDNVECRCQAVDAADGILELMVSRKSALSTAHMGNRDGVDQVSLAIPCVSLETLMAESRIDRIHLLKVDCEGSEYGIFQSLSPEIADRIDQIAMEIHPVPGRGPADLKANLEALGFDVECGYTWFAYNRKRRTA
ncbi:FkbM family methyltransferase [Paludisphaera soli]|uniref:FkbM family methyltransferase n=1 Tax=Paludisphaera soli TaxID=2712865 RepID=UPI0013E9F1D2|nr:FkbM family methyltransferase [Paludisphaera soli]